MKRINKISKLTKVMILLGAVIHTGVFLFFAMVNSGSPLLQQSYGDNRVNLTAINDKWLNYAEKLEELGINSFWSLGTVDYIAQVLVLIFLYKLFALYEKGEIFTVQSCRFLQLIGITLFTYGLLMIFLPAGISLFLNIFTDLPYLEVNYYFGSTELTQLIWGTVILVISWVMLEACHLKDEQGLVI